MNYSCKNSLFIRFIFFFNEFIEEENFQHYMALINWGIQYYKRVKINLCYIIYKYLNKCTDNNVSKGDMGV